MKKKKKNFLLMNIIINYKCFIIFCGEFEYIKFYILTNFHFKKK